MDGRLNFSDTTRRFRRNVVIVAAAIIFILWFDVTISSASFATLTFNNITTNALIWSLILILGYNMASWIVFGSEDYLAWSLGDKGENVHRARTRNISNSLTRTENEIKLKIVEIKEKTALNQPTSPPDLPTLERILLETKREISVDKTKKIAFFVKLWIIELLPPIFLAIFAIILLCQPWPVAMPAVNPPMQYFY